MYWCGLCGERTTTTSPFCGVRQSGVKCSVKTTSLEWIVGSIDGP
jgi:hypothetical protein